LELGGLQREEYIQAFARRENEREILGLVGWHGHDDLFENPILRGSVNERVDASRKSTCQFGQDDRPETGQVVRREAAE
jgi:hypothetical protein